MKVGDPVLADPADLTGASLFQILLGEVEAAGGPEHRLNAPPPLRRGLPSLQQDADALRTSTANATPELVQLGQPKPPGVLDNHDGGVREDRKRHV